MKFDVDRIEGAIAVLIERETGKKVDVPLSLLPPMVKEGFVLEGELRIDEEETHAARSRVAEKIRKLASRTREEG